MKRIFDVFISFPLLFLLSPLLSILAFLVWLQDGFSPFYIAPRMGKNFKPFNMIKLRSMIKNADKSGVDSTSANDPRITQIGHFIRRYKFDELGQLINVLKGDMSIVGPRPNVKRETDLYTLQEQKLLDVRPGITDIASIVFSDEGDILKGMADPDLSYNQLIRPVKSYLGLVYIEHSSLLLDLKICLITAISLVSRQRSLDLIAHLLRQYNVEQSIIIYASRKIALYAMPPPGSKNIVTNREQV